MLIIKSNGEKEQKAHNIKKINSKMEAIKSTLLLTALNANRLNIPIIRKTLVE